MKVISENMVEDGSAWNAVVEVRGVLYVASFVASKLAVRLAPYKHNPRRPRWAIESVQKWAQEKVQALPAAWIAQHEAMYS